MRWLCAIIFVLLSYFADAQVITHTFVDPCNGQVSVVTVPLQNGAVTIVYRGVYRVVTANDITSGELNAWFIRMTNNYPCPQTQVVTQVVTQAVNQAVAQATAQATAAATAAATSAATSAATAAATSAATSAASGAASSAATSAAASASTTTASSSAPAPAASTSSSGGGGSSSSSSSSSSESKSESSSSSSESKSESKSEEKSESKSESKEEKKEGGSKNGKASSKSQSRLNPMVYSSDLSVAQMGESLSVITSLGMSQSSMMGDVSWGLTGMIWSNLQQFAVSGRYTKLQFKDGNLKGIMNYGATAVSMFGNQLGFLTAARIQPLQKWGVAGANYTFTIVPTQDNVTLSNSLLFFYTRPTPVTRRLTLSPELYVSGTSLQYSTQEKQLVSSGGFSYIIGTSADTYLTKRFKLNTGVKMMIMGSEIGWMFAIGTKMGI